MKFVGPGKPPSSHEDGDKKENKTLPLKIWASLPRQRRLLQQAPPPPPTPQHPPARWSPPPPCPLKQKRKSGTASQTGMCENRTTQVLLGSRENKPEKFPRRNKNTPQACMAAHIPQEHPCLRITAGEANWKTCLRKPRGRYRFGGVCTCSKAAA